MSCYKEAKGKHKLKPVTSASNISSKKKKKKVYFFVLKNFCKKFYRNTRAKCSYMKRVKTGLLISRLFTLI